ncbi:CsbD family protein [Candidatus Saccharibacteria bacterium]|nr:MAG: CsbD family protein [Candidatus Saccharibacteria bacterium]
MSHTSDKISGKTKQAVGKMTDNKKLQSKGKIEEAKGEVKETLNDARKKMTD